MTGLLPERYPFYVGWKIDVEVHEIKLVIRNIIFDMVGVVIRFDTEKYYNEHIIIIRTENS
jgi:hypothetical protein